MATVTGPLLSMSASGQVAGSFVFSNWKGRPVVRQLVVPANPNSVLQVSVRAIARFLGQNYANLTAAEKADWLAAAQADAISQINAFQRHNQDRWTQFLMPRVKATQAAGTAPVLGAQTLTGGVGELTVSQAITTANDIWGIVVCASQTTGFTPGRSNVKYVKYGIAGPISAVLTGLAAGTWYVRTAGFNRGGTASAFVAEGNVVVN